MNKGILKTAAELLKITEEAALEHVKALPEHNAFYFWNPQRGGNAVIIADSGEKLAATSAVSFEKHLSAFLAGKRN